MAITIVRLGTERSAGEGLRIGTVRRPPRGVPKSLHASQNWYDVWLPDLAPSVALIGTMRGEKHAARWKTFERRYEAELKNPAASRLLGLLAALSRQTNFSIGCYCEDERYCHRSILRRQLAKKGAVVR